MARWLAAALFVAMLGGAHEAQAGAHTARLYCVGDDVSAYYAPHERIEALSGCAIVTGIASHIAANGVFLLFHLRPNRMTRYVLNAHNMAQGGYILVIVHGRSSVHGHLTNGARVQVGASLVHDVTKGPNYLAAPQYVSVLPPVVSTLRPTPAPRPVAFVVRALVTPATMSYNAYPTLTAYTTAGASCTAAVVYSTGRAPVSFSGSAQTVPAGGSVSWSWHEETKGTGGIASVTCSYKGVTKAASASFRVVNA